MNFDFFGTLKKVFRSNKSRENLKQNFTNKNDNNQNIKDQSRQQSLKDSQGTNDFSGSGYNGPGNVDHEKTNSNMGQRNY